MNSVESVFKLAILAAKRAQELSLGSHKLVETDINTKLSMIALQEIVEKKITYREKKGE